MATVNEEARKQLAAAIKEKTHSFTLDDSALSEKAQKVKAAIAGGGWDGREESIYRIFSAMLGENLTSEKFIPVGVAVVEVENHNSHNYGDKAFVVIDSKRAYGLRPDGVVGNHGSAYEFGVKVAFVERHYARVATDEEIDEYVAALPDAACAKLLPFLAFDLEGYE